MTQFGILFRRAAKKRPPVQRVLAFLFAALLALPVLPTRPVLANYQNPVTDLALTNLSPATPDRTGEYRMNFKFTRPAVSVRSDNRALNEDMTERATNFDLYWQDASPANAAYSEANKVAFQDATPNETIDYIYTPTLDFGRIYQYRVIPWHTHSYPNPTTPGGPPVGARAPLDLQDMTKEVLYLSDIQVTATGTDRDITVVWDNPTYHGNDLFTSYKIYYEQGGALAEIDDTTATFKSVSVEDPALIRLTGDGKLSYTFENPGLEIGTLYAVKVVPEYNGRTIDQGNLAVRIGTKDYPIAASGREYRYNDMYLRPSLVWYREGMNYLRLEWASYLNTMLDVESAEIYMSDKADFSDARNIAVISAPSAKTINYALVDRPLDRTYYKVLIRYNDNTNPQKPVIRTLETMICEYNPAYEAFDPIKPAILAVEDTDDRPYTLGITWEAFVRKAYTDAEKGQAINAAGDIIDRGVLYDIYVTDDLTNFDMANNAFLTQKIVDSLPAEELEAVLFELNVENDVIQKQAYTYDVQQYITREEDGYARREIVDNKIYYIMIVAKRDPSGETSARSYYAYYYEPKDDISVRPVMLAKPPLRIKTDENGLEVITKESIAIQWDTNWYELYNSADGNWYSKAGIDASGGLVFGEGITDQMIAENSVVEFSGSRFNRGDDPSAGYSIVYDALKSAGAVDPEKSHPIRFMDLGDAQYETHVVPYDTVQNAGGYDAYAATLTEASWAPAAPVGEGGITLEMLIQNTNDLEAAPFLPNTAYTILLRAYVIREDGRKDAYYPNYVVATTLSDRPPLDVKPTVPVIEAVPPATDRTVTVRFEYTEGLRYELSYSDYLPDYPGNGTVITDEVLRADGRIQEADGKTYLYYAIKNLFPKTVYHVWVRAYADGGAADEFEYSNPISIATLDLLPPDAPKGLGLASQGRVDLYNRETGTDYEPIDYEYMIIEWFRDIDDTFAPEEGAATAPPPEVGAAAADILQSPYFNELYLVKFNNLIGNRAYYIRAKTRLIVTRGETGIAAYYQYIVQLSPNAGFSDAIEVTVPAALPETDPAYTLTKDSPWTTAIRLTTSPYDGEYDGDKNPAQYPLPEQDFEVLYDRGTDTLTYRYRSDETDQKGDRDNRADQRFISTLIQNRTYNVVADVSRYSGNAVQNGAVDLPYAIVKAMEERKVSLTVKSQDMTLTLMPGFLETNEVKALSDLSPTSKIKITLKSAATGVPVLYAAAYATQPRIAAIAVTTPTRTLNLTTLSNPYKADLKLANRYTMLDKNTAAYTYTGNDTDWVRAADGVYANETGAITFYAKQLSAYAVIARNIPQASAASGAQPGLYTVGTSVHITDMAMVNANADATGGQINKLAATIALGGKDVALNGALTEAEQNALTKSGILTSGTAVPREAALNALIRLYEVKTKNTIKDYTGISETPYRDIASAAPQYQTALLKAAELGFFGSAATANPKSNMTLGDLLTMADIIIQDAGL